VTDQRTLTKLAALREAMASAESDQDDSFAQVFSAFLDIAEEPALLDASKPTKSPVVKAALESSVRSFTGDDEASIQALRMLRYGGEGFLHGGFFAGSILGTFFYFEKNHQGILALHQGGSMTHFTRVTVTEVPPGAVPVRGPKGKQ
jgi:hypothetical protein